MATTGLLAVFFLVVAAVFSTLGQGGGVLYTPVQVWLGVDFHTAATTSLFLIMTTSFSSSLVFRRAKRIDWPLAIVLESAATVGSFFGGLSSAKFSGAWLSVFFGVFVAAAGAFMLKSLKPRQGPKKNAGRSRWFTWQRQLGDQQYAVNLAIALPVSFLAGLASGLVGAGGGILKVPLMTLLFGVPMDIAVGSTALMIGLTATGGFVGHLANSHWDWRTSLWLAVAVFVGGQIGSRISVQVSREKLQRGFGWFLLVIAMLMLLRACLAT